MKVFDQIHTQIPQGIMPRFMLVILVTEISQYKQEDNMAGMSLYNFTDSNIDWRSQ